MDFRIKYNSMPYSDSLDSSVTVGSMWIFGSKHGHMV